VATLLDAAMHLAVPSAVLEKREHRVGRDSEWPEKLRALAQEHIDEPVLAAGVFAPAGAVGSMGAGTLSPLTGMFRDRQVNKRSGGLGHHGTFKLRQALIAVTADRVFGFNSKPKGRSGWQIVDHVATWNRRDVRVTVADARMTRMITFAIASTGQRYEFEMMKLAGTLNDALLDALSRPF
jgi:hypothetical protein